MDTLKLRAGGVGEPTVLLLHGLGATGAVWDGLTALLDGSWLAPDLPGHGDSARLASYSFEEIAAVVAAGLPSTGPLVVLGHSFGGVVALALASGRFGVTVARAVALGVKVDWSAEDLARAADLAARPARVFPTRAEAEQSYLKTTGLTGLAPADPAGVVADGDGWRLALDRALFAVNAPDMPGLLAAATCPVVLAAGEHDPMCPADRLRALSSAAVILPGLGHNAHVEAPATVRPLLG